MYRWKNWGRDHNNANSFGPRRHLYKTTISPLNPQKRPREKRKRGRRKDQKQHNRDDLFHTASLDQFFDKQPPLVSRPFLRLSAGRLGRRGRLLLERVAAWLLLGIKRSLGAVVSFAIALSRGNGTNGLAGSNGDAFGSELARHALGALLAANA